MHAQISSNNYQDLSLAEFASNAVINYGLELQPCHEAALHATWTKQKTALKKTLERIVEE